jgi:AhpD family alkylhydroperoxidase
MIESQLELEENRKKHLEKFNALLPGLKEAYNAVRGEVYRDGVLSVKVKRLMSLAVALGAGCRNCILAQATLALNAGATVEEVLETCSVVVSMRGTTGVAESLRVIELLEEMGKV